MYRIEQKWILAEIS